MLEIVLETKGKYNALHRLGITMHVYADTWAHQKFAGILHEINDVDNPKETDHSGVFDDLADKLLSWFADKTVPRLGHGQAHVLPDMPFLKWKYINCNEEEILRNNTEIFCEAAEAMCKYMQKYRGIDEAGLSAEDATEVQRLFVDIKEEDADKRHQAWLEAINNGKFTFGPVDLSYAVDGNNSWKAAALGTEEELSEYNYRAEFLDSDWKKFHDAIQQHRLILVHEILPRYGICAA